MAEEAATGICPACQQECALEDFVPGEALRDSIVALIQEDHSEWTRAQPICRLCLDGYRSKYVEEVLKADRGELSVLELGVMRSLQQKELLAENTNEELDRQTTPGQRVADKMAQFGGSWAFIITFGAVIAAWITINSIALLTKPFDPFPYILLNLVLSCLASIQAPVIMMSQNRMEAKDRLRAEHDYQVNLKAEMEIRHLHEKVDHLLTHQWERLAEIQQIQMDLMAELAKRGNGNHG